MGESTGTAPDLRPHYRPRMTSQPLQSAAFVVEREGGGGVRGRDGQYPKWVGAKLVKIILCIDNIYYFHFTLWRAKHVQISIICFCSNYRLLGICCKYSNGNLDGRMIQLIRKCLCMVATGSL